MVHSFDSDPRPLFRLLFALVVVVTAANVAAAANAASENGTGTDDISSLFLCEEIEPFWTSVLVHHTIHLLCTRMVIQKSPKDYRQICQLRNKMAVVPWECIRGRMER